MFNKNKSKDNNYTIDDLIKVEEENGKLSLYTRNNAMILMQGNTNTPKKHLNISSDNKYNWNLYRNIEVFDKGKNSIIFKFISEPHYCISTDETIENSYIGSIGELSDYFIKESGNYHIKYKIIKTIQLLCNGTTTLLEKELESKKEIIEVSQIDGLEYFKKYIEENDSYYLIENEKEYLNWRESQLKIETWCWLKVSNLLDKYGLIPSFQMFIDKIGTDIEKYKLAESLLKTIKNTAVLYLAFRDNFLDIDKKNN